MKVRLRLFAVARDVAGAGEVDFELATGATVGDLRVAVASRWPALAPSAGRILVAINSEYASDDRQIPPDGEVAIIPPVSGG
jgi:molybdopterin converting factor subunit 1